MVANTDKGRMISLCGSGIDVFEQRSADERTAVLDALQRFKDGNKVEDPKHFVLGTPTQCTLPAVDKPVDPKQFFKTRTGLYVWDGYYRDRILSVAKKVKSLPALMISHQTLIKAATDAEIRRELPEGHIFQDTSAFCVYLSVMIEQQKNSEDGILLNNGYANIFYVIGKNGEVFMVGVDWCSDYRRWDVFAWPLGVNRWDAGSRAFSATAGS